MAASPMPVDTQSVAADQLKSFIERIERLEEEKAALAGDTVDRHATRRGLTNALIEIRQDLIADREGQKAWAERFARLLRPLLADPERRMPRDLGSRTRDRLHRPR